MIYQIKSSFKTILRLAILLPLSFLLLGCAADLFIKGNQEASVNELLRTIDSCNKRVLGPDFKQLEGKLFFAAGYKLTSSDFSNQQKPSVEEAALISKLISNQTICESNYLDWAKEHAPKATQLTMVYSSLNIDIYKKLAVGGDSYGQAVSNLFSNLAAYWKHLKLLEINIAENNKESTKQFLRDYLIKSALQDAQNPTGNLIVGCGARGVNFVTGSCN